MTMLRAAEWLALIGAVLAAVGLGGGASDLIVAGLGLAIVAIPLFFVRSRNDESPPAEAEG